MYLDWCGCRFRLAVNKEVPQYVSARSAFLFGVSFIVPGVRIKTFTTTRDCRTQSIISYGGDVKGTCIWPCLIGLNYSLYRRNRYGATICSSK